MPVALISMRTSPGLGPSKSSSTISSGFLASNATAARVFKLSSWQLARSYSLQKMPNLFHPPLEGGSNAHSAFGEGSRARFYNASDIFQNSFRIRKKIVVRESQNV